MLLSVIVAFFVIPTLANNGNEPIFIVPQPDHRRNPVIVELNSCDSTDLIAIRGIGPYFASRILRYRAELGGFYHLKQLNELKMRHFVLDSIIPYLCIDQRLIVKRDLNRLTFKEMLHHPYLVYEEVKILFQLKREIGTISIALIRKHGALPEDKINKLCYYFI